MTIFRSFGYLSPKVHLYHACVRTALGIIAASSATTNMLAGDKSRVGQNGR